jgi:hypothetical protein
MRQKIVLPSCDGSSTTLPFFGLPLSDNAITSTINPSAKSLALVDEDQSQHQKRN